MTEFKDGDRVTGRAVCPRFAGEVVTGVLLPKGSRWEDVDERTLDPGTLVSGVPDHRYVDESSLVLVEPAVTPRASILREAESLITGDRNKAYGSPTQNFTNTAEIWTALIRHKLKDGEKIEPAEVASFMIGLKLARTVGEPKRDNWVDMAGYSGCGYEASEVES